MLRTPHKTLTVSELTLLVRDRLEQGFPDLWIEGEVSNLRTPGSGHLYFTLKDETSQIRAIPYLSGIPGPATISGTPIVWSYMFCLPNSPCRPSANP